MPMAVSVHYQLEDLRQTSQGYVLIFEIFRNLDEK